MSEQEKVLTATQRVEEFGVPAELAGRVGVIDDGKVSASIAAALVRDAVAAQARHADHQEFCPVCRSLTSSPHVHKEDESGLDDGPMLSKSQQIAARRANARKLADAGLPHDLIAKVLGVSRPTITADLSKEGE